MTIRDAIEEWCIRGVQGIVIALQLFVIVGMLAVSVGLAWYGPQSMVRTGALPPNPVIRYGTSVVILLVLVVFLVGGLAIQERNLERR